MIAFVVHGEPRPKGSTRAFIPKGWKRPIITEDNKATRPWAALVKDGALQAMEGGSQVLITGGVFISLHFFMPRPPSIPKCVIYMIKKPDIDKLQRAVFDALKGVVWNDDNQVVCVQARKDYVSNGGMTRVELIVAPIEEVNLELISRQPEARLPMARVQGGLF